MTIHSAALLRGQGAVTPRHAVLAGASRLAPRTRPTCVVAFGDDETARAVTRRLEEVGIDVRVRTTLHDLLVLFADVVFGGARQPDTVVLGSGLGIGRAGPLTQLIQSLDWGIPFLICLEGTPEDAAYGGIGTHTLGVDITPQGVVAVAMGRWAGPRRMRYAGASAGAQRASGRLKGGL